MKRRNIFGIGLALGMALPPAAAWAALGDEALALAARADNEEGQGAHDDALVDLTKAIEMHVLAPAQQARLLFNRGVILDATGRTNDAIGDYSAALQLNPQFSSPLNNRANAYRRQGRFAEAVRDYRAALAAGNPRPAYSWYGLGQVAEAQGQAAAAREAYTKAVAVDPDFALAADRLAVMGGMPAGTAADVIHLKPPKSLQGADATATLKPPSEFTPAPAADADAPLHLHMPSGQGRMTPAHFNREAKNEAPPGPGLRPALDGTETGAPAPGRQVQLGAWRSEAEAGIGWNKAVRQAGGLLDGLSPHIVAVDLPGRGRYYRLRVGPVARPSAGFCDTLSAHGLDCIPARN